MIMLDGPQWDGSVKTPVGEETSQETPESNTTPAVKKTAPKKEEEISVEDLPF